MPRNEITRLIRRAPEVKLTDGKTIRPTISGATAEWILERPQTLDLVDAKLLPFAKYDPVTFRHCVAGTAPAAAVNRPLKMTLTGSRLFGCSKYRRPRPLVFDSYRCQVGSARHRSRSTMAAWRVLIWIELSHDVVGMVCARNVAMTLQGAGATKLPDGQINSDLRKSCQAPK